MSKAVVAAGAGTPVIQFPDMPANAMAFFDQNANVKPKLTVPTLSPGGKKWTISLNGNDTVVQRRLPNGDIEPVNIFRVFILDYNALRGRAYYSGGYDPEKPGLPVCWSDDGIKPHARVETKQNPTCSGCPMAAKGSKVTDANKATRACSEHRMLAVIPASKLDFEPLRLKIAVTSDWDGQSPDHTAEGWHAFSNYMDTLRAMMPTQTHTARVVTKMRFDPNPKIDYPKVEFSVDRASMPEEIEVLIARIQSEQKKINDLITGTFSPNGRDGTRTDEDEVPGGAPANGPKPQGPDAAAVAKAAQEQAAKAAVAEATRVLAAKTAAEAAAKTAAAVEAARIAALPKETPAQVAARKAKEAYEQAMAAAEAEASAAAAGEIVETGGEGATVVGAGGGDEEIIIADGQPASTKAAAQAGKPAGKAKAAVPATAPPPPANDAALAGLLTDWE